ncbi:GNAT family N-acetyltransferase [Chryseobacterium sp.]|uniref:GNAT family N-acetyltransferase n=1 Tax=Chryseobacterium sp. TaxID=1871047 RepID=UPI0028A0C792|nr:GNAT family N-acetyltransferase [Chryseobacterium sp.]
MKLIKATEQDIEKIQDLARRSWESTYSEIISASQLDYMLNEMYSEQELQSHFQHPNYHYFLVIDSDLNDAGFIGFENHYEENTTKLHRIYLVPESKGKGLGKKTLEFLTEKVKENGDNRIILNVNKYNSALKFYESQGYQVYGEGVFDIGNGYVMDDFLMEKFV